MSSSEASREPSTPPEQLPPGPTANEYRVQGKKWFPRNDPPRPLEQLRSLGHEQLADPQLGPTLEEYRMLSPRDGTKWTAEETALLYRLRCTSENMPYVEIARRLQRSVLACRLRVHNLRERRVKGFERYDTSVLASRFGRRRPPGGGGGGAAGSRPLVPAPRQRRTLQSRASAPPITQPGPSQPQPVQPQPVQSQPAQSQPVRSQDVQSQDVQPQPVEPQPVEPALTSAAHALIALSQGNRSSEGERRTALATNEAARGDSLQQQPEDFSEPTSPHNGPAEPAAIGHWTATLSINESVRPGPSQQSPRASPITEVEPRGDSSALESTPTSRRMSLAHIMNPN